MRIGLSKKRGSGKHPLVFDNFNRPDALTLGSAKTGQPWVVSAGDYGIKNNMLYLAENSEVEPLCYIDAGVSDCAVSAKFYGGPGYVSGNSATGINFRISDKANLLRFYPDNLHFRIGRFEAGSLSVMGNNSTIAPANGQILRVVIKGTSIKCYVDDKLVFDITSSFNTTATKHGLYIRDKTRIAQWSSFKVEEIV